MSDHRTLRALLEANRVFISEQREINAAIMNTYLGVAMGKRQGAGLEPVSITELAHRIELAATTVSRHVRYLGPGIRKGEEGLGLVELIPSPEDGREKLVRLTIKGEALLSRLLIVGPR